MDRPHALALCGVPGSDHSGIRVLRGECALSGPKPFLDLLLPGLCLAYGLYAVRATTKRLQHLERARVALEMTREEEQVQAEKQAQATAQYEA